MTALAHSAPRAAKPLPLSLQAHTPEELAEVSAEAWDLWLDSGRREIAYRRRIRVLEARVTRLQTRLRHQYTAAHSHQETVLPSF